MAMKIWKTLLMAVLVASLLCGCARSSSDCYKITAADGKIYFTRWYMPDASPCISFADLDGVERYVCGNISVEKLPRERCE